MMWESRVWRFCAFHTVGGVFLVLVWFFYSQQGQTQQQQEQQAQPQKPQSWTQVVKKSANKNVEPTKKSTQQEQKRITWNNRRILIPRTDASAAKTDVINIRNTINRVLREQKATKNTIVIAAAYNEKGTIVCITREDCTAAEVLKHKDTIYKELSKVNKIIRIPQMHVEWSKVIVYNV